MWVVSMQQGRELCHEAGAAGASTTPGQHHPDEGEDGQGGDRAEDVDPDLA